jgi:eukaryotic-like serine/threonine-protein kinase
MATIAADHHHLFGLLALQVGLIDQAQLVAAFHAWTRDKARPLADHLVALGYLTPEQRPVLSALAALHVEADGGDVEESLAAVRADRSIRDGLVDLGDPDIGATLGRVGSAHPPTHPDNDDPDRTASLSVGPPTSDGQRFRILRPHARGGLGAVFVALDSELNREVALKQIVDRHADDPDSRARFLLEAEVTGRLEHPGVVPVYGRGCDVGGRPFYAMRLVKGESLREAVEHFHEAGSTGDPRRWNLELRQLLSRFVAVCNVVAYAHSRGVIHRDLKPANILLGPYGETLVVDWGLAKLVGRTEPRLDVAERTLVPSSASSGAETLPGSALGTPTYMSPEQAAGDLEHLGPQSDVYSLGAILYCLLTGKPPLEGDDIGELLRRAQRGEVTPPRQLDPSIDKALEAICLKAMATRSEDRYVSCRELAEDVERWMADEPVAAWREPWTRTLLRWLTRHRTGVTGAAAAVLVGVVGLSGVIAVQAMASTRLSASLARETNARLALAAANARLTRSQAAVQARYDLAVEAIKTLHTGVIEDFLVKQDQFKELRDRLLKSASEFYGKLGAMLGQETDVAARRALAASNFELAGLTAKIGRTEDALAAHRAALAAREALAAEPGADAAATVDVGRSLTAVARLLEATGHTDEAMLAYRKAEERLAPLADPSPAAAPARAALAACRAWLGWLLQTTGHSEEGLAVLRLARSEQEALAAAPGAMTKARRELAETVSNIAGILLRMPGKQSEAEAEYLMMLSIYRKLDDDHPAIIEFRNGLAWSHWNLAFAFANADKRTEAEAEFRAALVLFRKLADDYPAITEFRSGLVVSHRWLGPLLMQMGRPLEAEAEIRAAIALDQKLAADSEVAIDRAMLGWLLLQTGRPSAAEAEYRAALALHQKVADDHADATQSHSKLADGHYSLGNLLRRTGKSSEAEVEYRRAIALEQKLADDHPADTGFRSRLADGHNELGWLLVLTGKPSGAEAELRAALVLFRKLAEDNPQVPYYRNRVANTDNNLSVALRRLRRPTEARVHCEGAISVREALVKEYPKSPGYRGGLAENYLNRGLARRALGDSAGASADIRRAAALCDGLPSRSEDDWYLFACSRAALAGLAGQAGSGVSAGEATSEADAAMALLHKAVAMGFRNADTFRTEDALDRLQGREDFKLLMMDLAFPAEPLARAE